MFGKIKESLDYNVYPSPEGEKLLAEQQAISRIECIDGVEFLDGNKLPPDDDEIWNPTTYSVRTYYMSKTPYFTDREVESTITNRTVRMTNIRSISRGLPPLFIKLEDLVIPEYSKKPSITSRFKKIGHKILEKVA